MVKKVYAFIIAVTMLLCIQPPTGLSASEEGVAVHLGHGGAGGTKLNYIVISGCNYRTQIILAQDMLNSAESVNSMLDRAGAHGEIAAAFVGTYFTPYDGSNTTEGFLLQDGEVQNPKWFDSYLVFTNDREWHILDRFEMMQMGIENLMTAVAADPRIIRDGQKSLERSNGITPEAMMQTNQRTLVGVMADGSLLVAEGVTDYDRAADTLLALGCVDAMAMDGGASSFLYANGKTVKQAGRNLNNIVVVYKDVPSAAQMLSASVAPVLPASAGSPASDPTTPVMPTNPFADVTGTDWFIYDAIYVYNAGLMAGTGSDPMMFSPDAPMTRGMAAAVVHRMAGTPAPSSLGSMFDDVSDEDYYSAAVGWAAENGIVGGYGGGMFGPADEITREQLAAMLHRYARWSGTDVSVGEDTNILSFNDAFDISEYAMPALQWACGAGIIQGLPGGRLDPSASATRAEFAAMVCKFMSANGASIISAG